MVSNKKIIKIYVIVVSIIILFFSSLIIVDGRGLSNNVLYALILMFSPAFSALLINLIFYKNIKGFGWKLGKVKYLSYSYIIPILYILIPYSIAVFIGLLKLETGSLHNLNYLEFLKIFVINILILSIIVLGEEIGWRGFLLPHLCKITSFKKASIIVGLIWVLAHFPIFLFSDYNQGNSPLWFRLLCFTIIALSVNTVINWLRMKSGSIWPAVLLHATHNSILQDINPIFIKSEISEYIISESGLALVISGLIIGALFWNKKYSPD